QATALNMSNMIGIGPFITIPLLMSALNGGGPQAMLGWVVALVIAITDGMVWSELGAALPGSGGSYVYLREAFGRETVGRLRAFLFIWQFILSGPLEIASGFIGFGNYASYIAPRITVLGQKLIAAAIGVLVLMCLYRRVNFVGKLAVALWSGTVATMLFIIVLGAPHFDAKLAFSFPPGAFDFNMGFVLGLGSAMLIAMFDYLGYYNVCYIGDEVINPA